MKISKKLSTMTKACASTLAGLVLASSAYAADKLSGMLGGDIQDTLGGSGTFWKVYILVDIALTGAVAVKSKNPLVYGSVFFIALIPGLLVEIFVFN